MIKYAINYLKSINVNVDNRVIISGYSEGAKFASHFSLLHPELIKFVIAGGTSGCISMPVTNIGEYTFSYPTGISDLKNKAMLNIFLFCIGMLLAYYFVAIITNGVYNKTIIVGWTIFAIFSPILAYFTWMTKEKGVFPKLISISIVIVSILSSIILFDKLRIYDFIINGILIYYLFFKDIRR